MGKTTGRRNQASSEQRDTSSALNRLSFSSSYQPTNYGSPGSDIGSICTPRSEICIKNIRRISFHRPLLRGLPITGIREVRLGALSILSVEMSSSSNDAGLRLSLSFFTPSLFFQLVCQITTCTWTLSILPPAKCTGLCARAVENLALMKRVDAFFFS